MTHGGHTAVAFFFAFCPNILQTHTADVWVSPRQRPRRLTSPLRRAFNLHRINLHRIASLFNLHTATAVHLSPLLAEPSTSIELSAGFSCLNARTPIFAFAFACFFSLFSSSAVAIVFRMRLTAPSASLGRRVNFRLNCGTIVANK